MFSRSKSTGEMVDHARTMLLQGQTHSAAVTDLRVRWNLDTDAAEKLVQQVERELADARTSPVSSIRQQRQADNPGSNAEIWPARRRRRRLNFDIAEFWDSNRLAIILVGGLLFFMALMAVGIAMSISASNRTPIDSAVNWIEEPFFEVSADKYRFAGSITNNADGWAIASPELVTRLYNDADIQFAERHTDLIISAVGPNETRHYLVDVPILEDFKTLETDLEWIWRER